MVRAQAQAVRAVDAVRSSGSALGRLLGLGLGRRLLRRRRFWRWFFRWRRLVGRWRGVGELVMEFSKEDHEAVSAAIQQAEKRTSGQIVCVLAHASSDYAHIPILWATALALIAPWPTYQLHAVERAADLSDSTRGFYRRRACLFTDAASVCACSSSACAARARIAPRLSNSSSAASPHTKNRCGILIFVSLAERYARIIADDGIAQKVQASEWQAAIDALSRQHARRPYRARFRRRYRTLRHRACDTRSARRFAQRAARSALRDVGRDRLANGRITEK